MPVESGIKIDGRIVTRNPSADPGEFTAIVRDAPFGQDSIVYHARPSQDDTYGSLYLSVVPTAALDFLGLERVLASASFAFVARLERAGLPYEILLADRVAYFQHIETGASTFFVPEARQLPPALRSHRRRP